jgi:hypothetical protein
METTEAWAGKLRDNRNIGDFRRWKNHDAYQKALERVLRDLKMAQLGHKARSVAAVVPVRAGSRPGRTKTPTSGDFTGAPMRAGRRPDAVIPSKKSPLRRWPDWVP